MAWYAHPGNPHICGFYFCLPTPPNPYHPAPRKYLPQVKLDAHATIFSTAARTTLKQTFVNPDKDGTIPELRYTFPLYDGVSVVGFTCTVDGRVIKGLVKEKSHARQTYDTAVEADETAALLEQLPDASDVFTTTVGNVPGGAEILVELTYLGELKHDAEVDGIRYTIPTTIAPRYGSYPGELITRGKSNTSASGIDITVDVEMPSGSAIKKMQSPSHKISLHVGVNSDTPKDADMCLEKGHITLTEGTAELENDFVVQIVTQGTGEPVAMVEEHPNIPNHRALMATLVPRFSLPPSRPEVVFICDRSGSMGVSNRIPKVQSALKIFLKSLPIGVKFNICSFGSSCSFLWGRSKSYDEASLEEAMKHVDTFSANFGGTEMQGPVQETFKRRYKDMNLEMFMLTDGQIWDQDSLFKIINDESTKTEGSMRIFTLGIGDGASQALIEGIARAGNGFAQTITDNEKMDAKIVRMLKASLTPHITDYKLEVKYASEKADLDKMASDDDDFELIEKVEDGLIIDVEATKSAPSAGIKQKVISLFDKNVNPDKPPPGHKDTSKDVQSKYSHVPKLDEPKILQAPFEIPPLFPFSRTTVYLLLGPSASSQCIKSVVLKGTCEHGPLELEIPVTTLAAPGQTLHQLAAKKATQELEEGRGWLSVATDKKSGKLLKSKYEGMFGDMVEREGVRLGVKFQVAGKWCSFVAVEKKPTKDCEDDGEETLCEGRVVDPAIAIESTKSRSPKQSMGAMGMKMVRGRFAAGGMFARPAGSPPQSTPDDTMRFGLAPPAPMSLHAGVGMHMPAPTSVFSSSTAPPFMELNYQEAVNEYDPTYSYESMRSTPHARKMTAQKESSVGGGGPQLELVMVGGSAPMDMGHDEDEAEEESDEEFTEMLEEETAKAMAPAKPLNFLSSNKSKTFVCDSGGCDPLDILVGLQTFEGYWLASSATLWAVLGVTKEDVVKLMEEDMVTRGGVDVVATIAALAFLVARLKGEKDSWEMMAEKAEMWVGMKVGTEGVHNAVERVALLF